MLIHTSINILIVLPCDWLIKRKDFPIFYIIKCISIKDCIFHTCGGKEHIRMCLDNNHVAVWDLIKNRLQGKCVVKIQNNYTYFSNTKCCAFYIFQCFQWVLNIKVSGRIQTFSIYLCYGGVVPLKLLKCTGPMQDDCSARVGVGGEAE